MCLKKGLQTGSMLKAVEKAISEGYGVAILNPNANSVCFSVFNFVCNYAIWDPKVAPTRGQKRIPIANSASPEEHVLFVWETFIATSNVSAIYMFTTGNGSSLAVDLVFYHAAHKSYPLRRGKATVHRYNGRWSEKLYIVQDRAFAPLHVLNHRNLLINETRLTTLNQPAKRTISIF